MANSVKVSIQSLRSLHRSASDVPAHFGETPTEKFAANGVAAELSD
jgi:hypothetical protein